MAEQQFGRRRERDQAREQTAALVRRMSSLVVVDVDVDVASRACLPVLLPPLFGVSYNTSLDVNGMRCSKNMRGGRDLPRFLNAFALRARRGGHRARREGMTSLQRFDSSYVGGE